MKNQNEEIIHLVNGEKVKDVDLTPEQRMLKVIIMELESEIAHHQKEINKRLPSFEKHKTDFIQSFSKTADEVLESETKTVGEP
jgi:hypothetical protein